MSQLKASEWAKTAAFVRGDRTFNTFTRNIEHNPENAIRYNADTTGTKKPFLRGKEVLEQFAKFKDFGQVGHSILTLQVKGTDNFLVVTKTKAAREKLAAMAPSITINSTKFHAEVGTADILELRPRTKVIIYDAPITAPDEEIIELLKPYGDTMDGKVHWEKYPPPFNHIQSGIRFTFMKNIRPKEGLPLTVDYNGSLVKFRHPKQVKDPVVRAQIQAERNPDDYPEQGREGQMHPTPNAQGDRTGQEDHVKNGPQRANPTPPENSAILVEDEGAPIGGLEEGEDDNLDDDDAPTDGEACVKADPPPPKTPTAVPTLENNGEVTPQFDLSVSSYEHVPTPKTASEYRPGLTHAPKQGNLRQTMIHNKNRFWGLIDEPESAPDQEWPIPQSSKLKKNQTEKQKKKKKAGENDEKKKRNQRQGRQSKLGETMQKSPKSLSQMAAMVIAAAMENDQGAELPTIVDVVSPIPQRERVDDVTIDQFPSPRQKLTPPADHAPSERVERGELSQIIIQAAAELALDFRNPVTRDDSTIASSGETEKGKAPPPPTPGEKNQNKPLFEKRNAKRPLTPETKPSKRIDDKTTPEKIDEEELIEDPSPFFSDDSYY